MLQNQWFSSEYLNFRMPKMLHQKAFTEHDTVKGNGIHHAFVAVTVSVTVPFLTNTALKFCFEHSVSQKRNKRPNSRISALSQINAIP